MSKSGTRAAVDGKLADPTSALSCLLCCWCQRPLVPQVWQISCGHRLCANCLSVLLASTRSSGNFLCAYCHIEVNLEECFRDRGVENDLRKASFACMYSRCSWSGNSVKYQDHVIHCEKKADHCQRNLTTESLGDTRARSGDSPNLIEDDLMYNLPVQRAKSGVNKVLTPSMSMQEKRTVPHKSAFRNSLAAQSMSPADQPQSGLFLDEPSSGKEQRSYGSGSESDESTERHFVLPAFLFAPERAEQNLASFEQLPGALTPPSVNLTISQLHVVNGGTQQVHAENHEAVAVSRPQCETAVDAHGCQVVTTEEPIVKSYKVLENTNNETRVCGFSRLGCKFEGNPNELLTHERESSPHHLNLLWRSLETTEHLPASTAFDSQEKTEATYNRSETRCKLSRSGLAEDIGSQIAPLREEITNLESSLSEMQDGFSELALMVQTLQATNYNGEFIWKIPEAARRTKEARIGKTISLYSAPFYTSRYGYKMCLQLYLNGDGAGKGTHLSFFFTIMRGEYDTLLSWPFQQMVTLMLLDQDKKKNIVQCFRPEPSSSSFWKPKMEMNVASGYPKFVPLSDMDDPRYTIDDTIIVKVIVEKP